MQTKKPPKRSKVGSKALRLIKAPYNIGDALQCFKAAYDSVFLEQCRDDRISC